MNKKALYESIMKSVAKEVKKALNEANISSLNNYGDGIYVNVVNALYELDLVGIPNEPANNFDERYDLSGDQEQFVANKLQELLPDFDIVLERELPYSNKFTNAQAGDIIIMDGNTDLIHIDLKVASFDYIDNPSFVGTVSSSSIKAFGLNYNESQPNKLYMCVSADGSKICIVDWNLLRMAGNGLSRTIDIESEHTRHILSRI